MLQVLGVEDFGIYNVVGGIVALLGFISSSMSISIQRFLSYEDGQEKTMRKCHGPLAWPCKSTGNSGCGDDVIGNGWYIFFAM